MPRLTKTQNDFIKSMTNKQRAVLRMLDNFVFYMSASERCDRELDDLFRNKLVQAYHYGSSEPLGLPSWGLSQAGKLVVAKLKTGTI